MKKLKERLTQHRLRALLKKQRDILIKLNETLENNDEAGKKLIELPWLAEEIEDQANAMMDLGDLIAQARMAHQIRMSVPERQEDLLSD